MGFAPFFRKKAKKSRKGSRRTSPLFASVRPTPFPPLWPDCSPGPGSFASGLIVIEPTVFFTRFWIA